VDASGAAYVTGNTNGSWDFPTTAGAFDTSSPGYDAFVTKLNATGSGLLYSTYLGGDGGDGANAIAVDASGAAYVTGFTFATNFPTTAGAFDTSFGSANNGGTDAFLTKLNASGSGLLYSTYLGGAGDDSGTGIALDASGAAYVTGNTSSADFPTTNAYDTTRNGSQDAFVAKLDIGAACAGSPGSSIMLVRKHAPPAGSMEMVWSADPLAESYDVVYGNLGALNASGGNFTTSIQGCVAENTAALQVVHDALPPVGGAFFYLLRASSCAGPGTWDSGAASQVGSRDAEIGAAPGTCQP
jgi:hypothetical protein